MEEVIIIDMRIFIDPSQLNECDIVSSKRFDLTALAYRGGTSLSSGVLPKWDLLNHSWMIKRQTVDKCDWANEVLVYHFCKCAGISCAEYYPVDIRYFDLELRRNVECKAVLTKIFEGNLEHYRTLRDFYDFGSANDQIVDFLDRFPLCTQSFFDMLLVDFIFNQEDRHSKNFGVIGEKFAPLFDSGACLFYTLTDDILPLKETMSSKFKTIGKPIDQFFKEFLRWGYPVGLRNIPEISDVLAGVSELYSEERLAFLHKYLEKRCRDARKIFDEIRNE
jgi:hypothetical protein